jgi:hypothetical protein
MNSSFISRISSISLITLLLGLQSWAKPGINLSFKMTPRKGDFVATSEQIKGFAKVVGDKYVAEGVSVPVATLDAGMPLRTKHMIGKYLENTKYPEVKLIKAEGSHGQGTGLIEIHGVQKPIKGSFVIDKNELVATFSVKISEHGIAQVKYLGLGVHDDVSVVARIPIKK